MKIEDAVPASTRAAMVQIWSFIDYMDANPQELGRAHEHYLCQVEQHFDVLHRYQNMYTMELLTKDGADYFLEAADKHAQLFEGNKDEKAAYQIPEIVLSHHPELTEQDILAKQIGMEILWPLFGLMYGSYPNHFSSVQLARYCAPSNTGTGWHSDTESEASCVVSLAPERHVGGGTELLPYGAFGHRFYFPPLPKGHALLFNGRTTLHRGMEITEGQRNLLVYWMAQKDC